MRVNAPPPPAPIIGPIQSKPHGMSLAARPDRKPHPAHAGRDIFGRVMSGMSKPSASTPLSMPSLPKKSGKGTVNAPPPKKMIAISS